MKSETVERRYRAFLLWLAALLFAGTAVELWFVEHTAGWAQLLPFGLSAAGLGVIIPFVYRPGRPGLYVLRGVMGVIALGSVYGVFAHLDGNLGFALEIRPNATAGDVLGEALRGANPLLAPGILCVAAVIAVAATYAHPVLTRSKKEDEDLGSGYKRFRMTTASSAGSE